MGKTYRLVPKKGQSVLEEGWEDTTPKRSSVAEGLDKLRGMVAGNKATGSARISPTRYATFEKKSTKR